MSMYKAAEKVMYYGYDPDTAARLERMRQNGDDPWLSPEEYKEYRRGRDSLGWRVAGGIVGGIAGGIAGRGLPAKNIFEKAAPVVLGAGVGSYAGRKAYEALHDD